MKRHVNIPVFIPHLGCPNQCVFCNQRSISGVRQFDLESVVEIIENALSTINTDCYTEIAFFGGSFTGIDRNLMIRLLEIAYGYVSIGKVNSIRCSTRPDYINEEILDILAKYGVRVIELGLQSTSSNVLFLTKRGHTFEDEVRSCELIIKHGFELVGQMMIGLPGSTLESELETARFIISSGAKAARIYPTVVFYETELCDLAKVGYYVPLSEREAVVRSAAVLECFLESDVDVIRIGLCASENLASEKSYYAGPNHPALGELIVGEVYYKRISDAVNRLRMIPKNIVVYIARGRTSAAIGQRRVNKQRLIKEFGLSDIKFREDENLCGFELKIEQER